MCEKQDIGFFNEDGSPVFPEEMGILPDMQVCVGVISLLKEAKERHLPILITNEDKTRALYIKDANQLNCKISVNGTPFEEI